MSSHMEAGTGMGTRNWLAQYLEGHISRNFLKTVLLLRISPARWRVRELPSGQCSLGSPREQNRGGSDRRTALEMIL